MLTTFPIMIKHEKHIDKRAKISENSNEFLHSLKKFEDKFEDKASTSECYHSK